MGRGNCHVSGAYEGLYYVDKNYLDFYVRKDNPEEIRLLRDIEGDLARWEYDDFMSEHEYEDFKETLTNALTKRFTSFFPCKRWIKRERYALLENKLFYICLEDNEWSVAVELIAKDDDYLAGLQAGMYQTYLDGMRDCLFEQFSFLGFYTGPWTSGRIEKPDDKGKGKIVKKVRTSAPGIHDYTRGKKTV